MYANRGMYVEEIINRTISYLQNQNCIIEKRNIPIKIIKKVNGNKVLGILLDKSTVDYCGFVNNQHIEFEAKQTNQANFNVKLLQPHQYEFLLKAKSIGAVAFVIVHFTMYDEFYLLPIEWINQCLLTRHKQTIAYDSIKQQCHLFSIIYPGILNLIEKI